MSMPLDPRPAVVDRADGQLVVGSLCPECGWGTVLPAHCCPGCGALLDDAEFGPGGTVWASTVVRVAIPGREPPYVLAYVDLDRGPRMLAHVRGEREDAVSVGARVLVAGKTPDGDVLVDVA